MPWCKTLFLAIIFTLELLEPVVVTELEKPKIDEAGAKVIVTKWLNDTYGVNINDCDWEYFYYNIEIPHNSLILYFF